MNTRLEIFVDGEWQALRLRDNISIKYNKLVNRIGSINTREISHSNTFTIPSVFENRELLGLNVYNHEDLAKALNSKYDAKYYIENKIVQEGFLVINASAASDIKVNFIDQSLGILDRWGVNTLRDLLNDEGLPIPADYVEVINQMKGYVLTTDAIVTPLNNVGVRGHKLALYPNNLNTIGEEYLVDADENRPDNVFNAHQSRPIFNNKAIFDLACYAYGYTPIYDDSVDWRAVERTYTVASGLGENFLDDGTTTNYSTVINNPGTLLIDGAVDRVVAIASPAKALAPNSIVGWQSPEAGFLTDYLSLNCVYKPNLELQPAGVVRYTVNGPAGSTSSFAQTYGVWSNQVFGSTVVFKQLSVENGTLDTFGELVFDVNKSQLFDKPAGADVFIGIFTTVETDDVIQSFQISETFIPIEAVNYDDFGQFQTEAINLTYAAPRETIKELMIGMMTKEGILMNIDNQTKEIRFYNYLRYITQIENNISTDFSDYLLEYTPYNYNTDFGNEFAKINEIGLSSPFKGNTYQQTLDNQGSDSKLKDFSRNLLPKFRDVSEIKRIPNSQTPYFEYTNQGLGFVREQGVLGNLTQIKFLEEPEEVDGMPVPENWPRFQEIGTVFGVPRVVNVNYSDLPAGILEWYRLVGNAVKASPSFLVPIDVIRNIDLTSPIFIEQMGGYYIIEEIAEYENSQKRVVIKVLKSIDGAEYNDDYSNDFNI